MTITNSAEFSGIFTDLANPSRYSMLFKLAENQYKQSKLANEIDITIQESHRQVSRLTDSGLIQKNTEGLLTLTPFGRVIVAQLTSFVFLQKFKDYFMNHNTTEIPSKFLERFGDLLNCELLEGIFRITEKWEEMCIDTKEFMNVSSTGCPPKAMEWDKDTVRRGATVKILNGRNTIMTRAAYKDLTESKEIQKFIKDGKYQRRLIDRVSIFMVINEKEATIQFEDLNGKIDPNYAFYSKSEKFLEWCSDYFEYLWKTSERFDFAKLEKN